MVLIGSLIMVNNRTNNISKAFLIYYLAIIFIASTSIFFLHPLTQGSEANSWMFLFSFIFLLMAITIYWSSIHLRGSILTDFEKSLWSGHEHPDIILYFSKLRNGYYKKWIAISLSLLIVIASLSVALYSLSHQYNIEIERDYSSDSERIAIQKAEELDIATILDVSRYEHSDEPQPNPTSSFEPNIIDKTTLDHYNDRINNLKSSRAPIRVHFNYLAKAKTHYDFSIFIDYNSHTIRIDDRSNPTYLQDYYFSESTKYAYFNNSQVKLTTYDIQNIQIELSIGYSIVQDLDYEEYQGPMNQYGGGLKQIIIMDKEYEPIFIMLKSKMFWIT
jgi:hypothetical protein